MAGSLPYAHVSSPPEAPPALYGLFSAATVLEGLSAPATAGVQYEVDCDTGLIPWPGPCPLPDGSHVERSVGVTFTGTLSGGTYTVFATAIESDGAVLPIQVTVTDGTPETITVATSGNPTVVYTGTAPLSGTVTVTSTGTSVADVAIHQNTDDGSLIDPTTPVTLVWEDTIAVDPAPPKVHPPSRHSATGDPFTLVAVEQCSLVGYTMDQLKEFSRRKMRENEQRWVERIVWTGMYGNAPTLSGCIPDILSETPVDIVTAVSLAESWYGENLNGRGVFHVNSGAAAVADRFGLLHPFASKYNSTLGHAFAFGDGYPKTGPGGSAPAAGAAWMFVTGPVTVRRTVIRTADGMHYRQNQPHITSERIYVVDWACGCAAVQVDLTKTGTAV